MTATAPERGGKRDIVLIAMIVVIATFFFYVRRSHVFSQAFRARGGALLLSRRVQTHTPGDEVLVIFMDAIPTIGVISSFLEAASRPQSLRFMYFASTTWDISDLLPRARPRGAVTEAFVFATVCAVDPVSAFDDVVRAALKRPSERTTIFSHAGTEVMKMYNHKEIAPARLRRCVVPAQCSAIRSKKKASPVGVSFSIPDCRFLVLPRSLCEILELWYNDVTYDIMLADLAQRFGLKVASCTRCLATLAPGSGKKETTPLQRHPDAGLLRTALITSALFAGKSSSPSHVGYFDIASDLALVYTA